MEAALVLVAIGEITAAQALALQSMHTQRQSMLIRGNQQLPSASGSTQLRRAMHRAPQLHMWLVDTASLCTPLTHDWLPWVSLSPEPT